MSSTHRVAEARELLSKLKQRLIAGEIDELAYDRLRQRVLDDLTPGEYATLGITTATPHPVSGVSPRPGTPLPTPGPTPVGPLGGVGHGLRTARANLADLELAPGTVLLGQWELVRELGRGGFGAVFEAEELSLGVRHAVKILDPAMVAKEELLARFRREVSLMRKLVHPRIVRVYDYREDLSQDLALISMELVADGSVKQLLAEAKRRGEPIPLALGLKILGQILEALAEAHRQGVIHRDVTPGNVLLAGGSPEQLLADPDRDPQVKLVDFGIAGLVERTELSAKSRVLGTAAYVAPEVLDPSVEVTPAADVYGAGAMGYELVTGHLPVGRFDEPIELRKEIGKELNRFLLSLLATRPEARPSPKAAARDLRELGGKVRLESERQSGSSGREEQEAQKRNRQEQEHLAGQERQRQAGERHKAGEARHQSEAQRAPASSLPSLDAHYQEPARRSLSGGAWVAIALLLASVIFGVGWGIRQQQLARQRAVLQEQEIQAAIGKEQRKAADEKEAERQRQARLLEEEKQRATQAGAQTERQRIDQEQSKAAEEKEAERLRQAQILEEEKQKATLAGAQSERQRIEREQAAEVARVEKERRATEEKARQEREARDRLVAQQAAAAALSSPPAQRVPAEVNGPSGLRWVRIPAGSFMMGCTSGDTDCSKSENPPHRVTISRDFALAETETTVGQYQACVSAGRCSAAGGSGAGSDYPVAYVDWGQSDAFCAWVGGRLPSEAEWEYAARGGQEGSKYPRGNSISHKDAEYEGGKGRDNASPVRSFAPNGYGLYDMAGNAYEWVSDDWHSTYLGAPSDGVSWSSGGTASLRVARGGSWTYAPKELRVSHRIGGAVGDRLEDGGFRCARTEAP